MPRFENSSENPGSFAVGLSDISDNTSWLELDPVWEKLSPRWEKLNPTDDDNYIRKCSRCGCLGFSSFNYCPYCGVKMEAENDD